MIEVPTLLKYRSIKIAIVLDGPSLPYLEIQLYDQGKLKDFVFLGVKAATALSDELQRLVSEM